MFILGQDLELPGELSCAGGGGSLGNASPAGCGPLDTAGLFCNKGDYNHSCGAVSRVISVGFVSHGLE